MNKLSLNNMVSLSILSRLWFRIKWRVRESTDEIKKFS